MVHMTRAKYGVPFSVVPLVGSVSGSVPFKNSYMVMFISNTVTICCNYRNKIEPLKFIALNGIEQISNDRSLKLNVHIVYHSGNKIKRHKHKDPKTLFQTHEN
jgi:hypothetical protein